MSTLDRATRRSSGLDLAMLVGREDVLREGDRLRDLTGDLRLAVTCRWPWVMASIGESDRPWAVTVTDRSGLVAAAVMVDTTVDGAPVTTLAGTAHGHRGTLVARSVPAARALGAAVAHALVSEPRAFSLGPLAPSDALSALLQYLPTDVRIDPVAIPLLVPGCEAEGELSPAMRRTLRKARNRLSADGSTAQTQVVEDPAQLVTLMREVLEIARRRDRAVRGSSPLDEQPVVDLWRRRLFAAAGERALRVLVLRIDGRLAAYVLCLADGPVLRVLDGRYVDDFARYAPGRLLEADLLERVRGSQSVDRIDWMTTLAPESLLAANAHEELVVVSGVAR